MNQRILVLSAAVAFTTAGCRLDPSSLLGRDPAEQDKVANQVASANEGCHQRVLTNVFAVDDNNCATPDQKERPLAGFSVNDNRTEIKVKVRRLSDGKFPVVTSVVYAEVADTSVSPVMHSLECKPIAAEPAAYLRETACRFSAESLKTIKKDTWFALYEVQFKNESCNASSLFSPKLAEERCQGKDPRETQWSDETFFERNRVPRLVVRDNPKPE